MQIRDTIGKLTKQNGAATWIGSMKEVLAHTLFWVSMINFVLIAATFYNTTFYPVIKDKLPNFSFILFLGALSVVVLIAMFVEYKFIIPSVLAFRNKQEYKHQNLIRRDLEKIKLKLGIPLEDDDEDNSD